jgi:hypothetical protein
MSNILFVLFQGSGTNLKSWNEYTESKFLDKLKNLGDIYTYEYGAVKKGTFLTTHSKMLAIIQKGNVPF